MATSTQIKASIDANITNKTAFRSINNTDVGADIKSVVDYVDQEINAVNNNLAPVATTGDYNSLDNLPALVEVATSGDYNDLDNIPTLSTVAITGSYNDLDDLPTNTSNYLESAISVIQTGTNDPLITNYFIDEIQISVLDNSNPLFRIIDLVRNDVGLYSVRITWKTGSASAVNFTKVDISSSDSKIRFGSTGSGSFGPYSFYSQDFSVYTPAGVLSDDILGSTNIYIRLFN